MAVLQPRTQGPRPVLVVRANSMAIARSLLGLAVAWPLVGCANDDAQPAAKQSKVEKPKAAEPATEQPAASRPTVSAPTPADVQTSPPPASPPEPKSPEPKPPEPPTFDPLTATEADVRIAVVHSAKGPACGILHTVGAIEVDVLGVGTPAPRLGLYISCPTDLQPRGMLTVGTTLHVTLHRRKQSWPKPVTRPPAELPVRYVRSLKPL